MDVDIGLVMREAILVMLKLGGPLLITALLVGLVVSLIQAVTQINEATLAFLPKLLALCGILILLTPFMTATMTDFMNVLADQMIQVGSQ